MPENVISAQDAIKLWEKSVFNTINLAIINACNDCKRFVEITYPLDDREKFIKYLNKLEYSTRMIDKNGTSYIHISW